jgi:ADP-ribosyl-[dinitrogen reductase] hydrolase
MENLMKDILLGMAVGDALGVPVEFIPRSALELNPVTGMMGYGTHNQPIGTWSDDSSMAFCIVEMLSKEYSLDDLTNRFINWAEYGYWTPHGETFDIGNTSYQAINRLSKRILPPTLCGGRGESDNGNGSVMRTLPLVDYLLRLEYFTILKAKDRFNIVSEISSLTHAHPISKISCFILTEYGVELFKLRNTGPFSEIKLEAWWKTRATISQIVECLPMPSDEFGRVFARTINELDKNINSRLISGSGYAVSTLEASIWCLLTTNSYKEATLKAVNLGDDTDTTACVTGGLAGILYGSENIPSEWLDVLVKREEIEDLINRYVNHHTNERR